MRTFESFSETIIIFIVKRRLQTVSISLKNVPISWFLSKTQHTFLTSKFFFIYYNHVDRKIILNSQKILSSYFIFRLSLFKVDLEYVYTFRYIIVNVNLTLKQNAILQIYLFCVMFSSLIEPRPPDSRVIEPMFSYEFSKWPTS